VTHALTLRVIGYIRSGLTDPATAPKQGAEGGPDAWLELAPYALAAARGLHAGQRVVVISWLHHANRDLLEVHPRDDVRNPLIGVFATRSADRPNPLGLHRVTIRTIEGGHLRIGPIEAIDGTPVVDLKIDIDQP
jgi:tRNA-Thr(GGU) m(6)t(6)A37 methyltransferase TsaA